MPADLSMVGVHEIGYLLKRIKRNRQRQHDRGEFDGQTCGRGQVLYKKIGVFEIAEQPEVCRNPNHQKAF